MKLRWLMVIAIIIGILPITVQAEEGHSVYYYILVDRFESGEKNNESVNVNDPEAFQGGDFQGIMNRIDHLNTLGVTDVILSPIFQSDDYTGHNVTSYSDIQETFGTEEQLVKLIEELNDNGIDVTLHFPMDEEQSEDEMLNYMTSWYEQLPIKGYYISNPDSMSLEFWQIVDEEIDGQLIAESNEDIEDYLDVGFDSVHDRSTQDDLKQFFKQPEQSIEDLLDTSKVHQQNIIQSIDFYDTDRFTHVFSETGSHPITYWKLALTYLLTIPNDTLIYQGSEIPLDGIQEDLSHHQLMNFLAGEDQIIRHMEKISNAYDDLPSLSKGELEIIHAEGSYLVFKKTYQDDTTIVAINTSTTQQRVDIELDDGLELRGLIEDDLVRQNDDGKYMIAVEREASNIFLVQEDTGLYWPLILIFVGGMTVFITFAIVMYRKNKNQT